MDSPLFLPQHADTVVVRVACFYDRTWVPNDPAAIGTFGRFRFEVACHQCASTRTKARAHLQPGRLQSVRWTVIHLSVAWSLKVHGSSLRWRLALSSTVILMKLRGTVSRYKLTKPSSDLLICFC